MTLTDQQRLLATARMERGILKRQAGDLQAAADDYRAALKLLEGADQPHDIRQRAQVQENLSNTLEDAGSYDDALDVIAAAIHDLQAVAGGAGRVTAELAGTYQNAANKLFKAGDYERARDFAVAALTYYRSATRQGRSDLAEDLARLESMHALTLERLLDIHGAIEATEAAISAFQQATGTEPATRDRALGVFMDRLESLRKLSRSGRADLPGWLKHIRMKLDTGAVLSRERDPAHAALFFEEAITCSAYLIESYPTDELHALLAESGVSLSYIGYAAGRPLLARRGGRIAIDSRRYLVEERGRREQIDLLGGAYMGLASFLTYFGADAEAEAVLVEMRACLGRVDPAKLVDIDAQARDFLAQARAVRES